MSTTHALLMTSGCYSSTSVLLIPCETAEEADALRRDVNRWRQHWRSMPDEMAYYDWFCEEDMPAEYMPAVERLAIGGGEDVGRFLTAEDWSCEVVALDRPLMVFGVTAGGKGEPPSRLGTTS